MRYWIIAGSVILAVTVLYLAWYLFSAGQSVQAAKAARGAIREFVDERGKTRLPHVHLVSMPFPARIEEISLAENEPVKAGQVVARVKEEDLANEVAEAQAVVDRLAASIAENDDVRVEESSHTQAVKFVESMGKTVEAALNRVRAGERKEQYASKFLTDVEKLVVTGAKTRDDLERAKVAWVEADVNYQQDRLVGEAMTSIQAATALLPRMVRDYISKKDLTRAVLEKQKSEAEARLRQVTTRKERGEMKSPVDGVVLHRLVTDEQFLAAGTALVEIGRLEELEIETDVLSEDVVRIERGQQVEIYGPAVGKNVGQGASGTVERIYPAGFTKVSSLGVEQQRVKVIVRFAEGALDELRRERHLGVDYRVRVRIFTAEKNDALLVPRSALFRGADGGWQVFAISRGRAARRPVEVGLMNDEQAEITAGVSDSDLVVLAPETNLGDGSRVKAVLREK
jgi:HlyD family secretion protein